MWIVIKYKANELKTLKKSFSNVLGDMPEFYHPKIKLEKYVNNKIKIFEKNLLENYLICRHTKFNDNKVINLIKYSRGLNYLLTGYEFNQKELNNFINFCKSNEDKNGFLTQSFFNIAQKTKAKFISGPFTQMIFDVIEKKGKKLKILLNNLNITVSNNSKNLLYSCI
tara:strand:- start:722 stop:1225 length:504 start_codon:yes stop_codon:yes gene_type:complete